jgi:hypothetical protein
VFFILATIGLGVATYFGFSEQDKFEKTAKDEKKAAETFKNDRNWYKFQVMMLRAYIGEAQGMADGDQLGTLKNQFDNGSLSGMSVAKDKDDVTKVLKPLETQFGWNGNLPKQTYKDLLAKAKTDYDTLAKTNKELQTALAKAKKEAETKDGELVAARADYITQLNNLKKTLKEDFTKSDKDLIDLRGKFTTLSEANKKDLEKLENEKKAVLAQLKLRDGEISELKKKVKNREDRIAAIEPKSMEAPVGLRTDWKIVEMDRRGTNPYINLGSADRVKSQLTFSIHGISADGQINPQPKGTLEVVNVINDHLSQTRITAVTDRNRDPILKGDVIYNPSWNPTIPKHVAIAGIIDLTGDGRDSLREFMRSLERQNIVVDAYLDPKDGSVKGKGITFRTDYLIIGDTPDAPLGGKDAGGVRGKIVAGRKDMETAAKKYGVPSVGLLRYLDMIGYRLPRGGGEERPSLYNPDLRPDHAPRLDGDKPPTPMKPDK